MMEGLPEFARLLERMGPPGHILAHITPVEAALLKRRGGAGTRHRPTGLLHFDDASDGDSGDGDTDATSGEPSLETGEMPEQVAGLPAKAATAALGLGAFLANWIGTKVLDTGWDNREAIYDAVKNGWDALGKAFDSTFTIDPNRNDSLTQGGDHARGGLVAAARRLACHPRSPAYGSGGIGFAATAAGRRCLDGIARDVARLAPARGLLEAARAGRKGFDAGGQVEGGGVSASAGEHSNQEGPSAEAGDDDASGGGLGGFAGSPEIGGSKGRISQAMAMEQAGSFGNFGSRVGINPATGEFGLQGTVNPAGLAAGILGSFIGGPIAGAIAGYGARAATQGPAGMYGSGWVDVGGLQSVNGSYASGRDPTGGANGADNAGSYDPSAGGAQSPLGATGTTPASVPSLRYDPLSSDPAIYGFGPEHLYFVPRAEGGIVGYDGQGHRGARIGGLVDDPSPGRADLVKTSVPANSYIIPADIVSGLGEGNTDAGAKRLKAMLAKVPSARPQVPTKMVPVRLSGGEYHVPPEMVAGIGGGSTERGARELELLVHVVRDHVARHARMTPPPKR